MKMKTRKPSATVLKRSAIMMAAAAFAAGFFSGVGFTVFKTASPFPHVTDERPNPSGLKQQEQMLSEELRRNPGNTAAWIRLGHVYFDTNQYAKAIGAYEKALSQEPGNADVLTDLGVMYRRNGQPLKALEKFDQAVAADPQHEIARLNKGIVLLHDLKDREGAIRAWEQLLEINPLAMAGENQSVDQLVKHYKEGHDKK